MAAAEVPSHGLAAEETLQRFENEQEPYIYTSVRYDAIFRDCPENTAVSFNIPCPFYMLEHHWTRMQVANWSAQFWTNGLPPQTQGRPADFLRSLLLAVKQWQKENSEEAVTAESLRVRRRAFASGRTTTEIWQIPRKPLSCFFPSSLDPVKNDSNFEWIAVLDNRPTVATEATMFKTWDRTPHVRARADAGIYDFQKTKEVLLYTPDGQILDGSNSTPYFYRNERWVTPVSSAGGLQGTTRRWALENGLCIEASISIDSFTDGETVWFSNGVKGFFWACYHACDPELQLYSASARLHQLT